MFGFGFYDVFIIAGILGVQHFLSTRDSVYWGALIPLVFVIWRTWILFNENENLLAYVLILLVGLAFLRRMVRGTESSSEKEETGIR